MSLMDDISGKAKEVTGQATGDQELEAKGKAQQIAGDVKDKASDAKDAVGDKVNDVLDGVNKDKLDGDSDKQS